MYTLISFPLKDIFALTNSKQKKHRAGNNKSGSGWPQAREAEYASAWTPGPRMCVQQQLLCNIVKGFGPLFYVLLGSSCYAESQRPSTLSPQILKNFIREYATDFLRFGRLAGVDCLV